MTLIRQNRKAADNSTYPKVAVQWLNQVKCFYQNLYLVDSFVLPCLPAGRETRRNAKRGNVGGKLKDDTAIMNNRNKYKMTGQMNHQKDDPKANASVFLYFSTAHFLKTILASRIPKFFGSTFGFAPIHEANASQNQKSHFLPPHQE